MHMVASRCVLEEYRYIRIFPTNGSFSLRHLITYLRIQGLPPPLYSLWCLQSSLEYMVSTGSSPFSILKLAVFYGVQTPPRLNLVTTS